MYFNLKFEEKKCISSHSLKLLGLIQLVLYHLGMFSKCTQTKKIK